ncbi:MAG: hypothetical protein ACOC1U_09270, partial [Spirochaetota bacterium]
SWTQHKLEAAQAGGSTSWTQHKLKAAQAEGTAIALAAACGTLAARAPDAPLTGSGRSARMERWTGRETEH